jgi:hypothetical protein
MRNLEHFTDLIPYILRSIPYVYQSHTCKAYCALENLYAHKSHFPNDIWDYCSSKIKNDEPKVRDVIAPELFDIDEIGDHTSGRNFGPDWILGHGLMPLSYWAIHQKVQQVGFENLIKEYIVKALEFPRFLGHEISILSAYWKFYNEVIIDSSDEQQKTLFLQRFTEYVVVTFSSGESDVIEGPISERSYSEEEVLLQSLTNPGFFGHHIIAVVWGRRLKPLLDEEQIQRLFHNLMIINGGTMEDVPSLVKPIDKDWSEAEFDELLITFLRDGPKNLHQLTLSEALLWCWSNYSQYRNMIAANLICFTNGTRP